LVNNNKRLDAALVLTAVLLSAMLFVGPIISLKSNAQELLVADDLKIQLGLSPGVVERGLASYDVGYVQLISNMTGEPILAARDIEIELSSRNTRVATVPPTVVIAEGSDYAQFRVGVSDVVGESDITALFGNHIVTKTFRVVEAGSQIPTDITLVVNLPSEKMQIGSEMPFSVYLENSGGIMQAPEDVIVTFDYDRSLLKVSSSTVTIKKGEYYALATVGSLEKSGNAFIKAYTTNPSLDSVSTIRISQTQPAALKTYVFPEKVGVNEKTIDVFVGLVDSSGNPTVAASDVRLDLFANSIGVHNIDENNAIIKKGEFGYHLRQSIVYYSSANVTIGATAPGLGVSTDDFEVVEKPLLSTSAKAQSKSLTIFTIPSGMPSDATSIVVYQLNAIEDNGDDGTDMNGDGEVDATDHHPIDDLEGGELYPIQSSLLYSTNQGNLNIVTTDLSSLRIADPGSITAGSSYGTATVASGRQPGNVEVSVSLANTASSSSPMEITGSLTPVQTMIFSPAGISAEDRYRIHFNQQGTADLFVLTLDSEERAARAEGGVQYLLEPMNLLSEIAPDATFASIQIHSSQFSPVAQTAEISAVPIGINADAVLQKQSVFDTVFFSSITGQVMFPFESVIGVSKSHMIGAVQLTDSFGNPLLASEDIAITLTSSKAGSVDTPLVTIPTGKSFATFALSTSGRTETLTITSQADGIRSTSTGLNSVLAELPGTLTAKGALLATQQSTVVVEADEGTSVLWGVPASFEVVSKEDKVALDPSTNTYRATAQIVASRAGSYAIEVTLLKDGFKPTRVSTPMTFEEFHAPLTVTVFHNSPSIEYNQPVSMNIRVVDSEAKPVANALVKINPGLNATAVPSEGMTDAAGILTFMYTPTGADTRGMVTATAEKAGYSMGVKSTAFVVENVPMIFPQWLMFGIIGAVAAGVGAGAVHHIKKPKVEQPVRRARTRKHEDDEADFTN
jgi:hypothetical protein